MWAALTSKKQLQYILRFLSKLKACFFNEFHYKFTRWWLSRVAVIQLQLIVSWC